MHQKTFFPRISTLLEAVCETFPCHIFLKENCFEITPEGTLENLEFETSTVELPISATHKECCIFAADESTNCEMN